MKLFKETRVVGLYVTARLWVFVVLLLVPCAALGMLDSDVPAEDNKSQNIRLFLDEQFEPGRKDFVPPVSAGPNRQLAIVPIRPKTALGVQLPTNFSIRIEDTAIYRILMNFFSNPAAPGVQTLEEWVIIDENEVKRINQEIRETREFERMAKNEPQKLLDMAMALMQNDPQKGAYLLDLAAPFANPDQIYLFGMCRLKGLNGVPMDRVKGLHFIKMAAAKDHPEALYTYGLWMINGSYGVPINLKMGKRFIEKAEDKKYKKATVLLNSWMVTGFLDIVKNKEDGLPRMVWSAQNGNSFAQYKLGMWMLKKEHGFDVSHREDGLAWIQKAIAQGDSEAQGMLGYYMVSGKFGFTEDDRLEGFRLLELSAAQGFELAQYNLAIFMITGQHGFGAERRQEGVSMLEALAGRSHAQAQYVLGSWRISGKYDVPIDVQAGTRLLRLSANQGYGKAHFALAQWMAQNQQENAPDTQDDGGLFAMAQSCVTHLIERFLPRV